MKFRVHVSLKQGVHDVQGEAVERVLKRQGHSAIANVRIGKFIDLEVEGAPEQAQALAEQAARELLSNPVIERYWLEPLK